MDWITSLQNAIDYIEENLTEELDYREIAKRACSSSFHFQRVFGILCGYTLGEYIRNRRLTLAGSELAATKQKVLDIALKYGYDSPESFGRAFTKFHGITPSQAKTGKASLRSFSPLFLKLVLEGGTMMDYRIEKRDAFQVIAKKRRFDGGKEINSDSIHEAWESAGKDGTIEALCSYVKQDGVFGEALTGICFDSPVEGDFDYAVAAAYQGEEVKEGLTVETVPANTWMIFKAAGPMPDTFLELWKRIYTEVLPGSSYQLSGGMCIEVYKSDQIHSGKFEFEIWLSVAPK